jgi:phosphohistidine swiveling domain-containing protein
MTENNDLVDINIAGKILGVSKFTLRNWDNSGILPAVRIGNRGDRRYKKEDLEKFLSKEKGAIEINKEEFYKWINHGNFWFEELPCLPITTELGIRKATGIDKWFKPGYKLGIRFFMHLFEKDNLIQVMSLTESIEYCKTQLEILNKNPHKIKEFFSVWDKKTKELEKVMTRLEFIELNSLSQEELLKEFDIFCKTILDFWDITVCVEPFDPFSDIYYETRFLTFCKNNSFAKEAFTYLSLPSKSSFFAEERKSMLRIIIKFLGNPKKRKEILERNNQETLTDLKINEPEFFEALSKHHREYYWIQNSYGGRTVLKLTDFLNFLKDTLKNMTIAEAKNELAKIENPEKLIQKQKEILTQLNLPYEIVNELEFIREITLLKDDRKKVVLIMLHHIFGFLEEFSRRTRIDDKLIGYCLVNEIPLLLKNSIPLSILETRRNGCALISSRDEGFSLITGNEYIEIKKSIFKDKNTGNLTEIAGSIASRGSEPVVRGIARVILNPKNETIGKDEILVTSMTRPEFVPLLKNAKGVITNEGGVTSHAAIVSRELNKPCIIGTKNATRVLQTGDEIEMRMNHGVVKIIKRE